MKSNLLINTSNIAQTFQARKRLNAPFQVKICAFIQRVNKRKLQIAAYLYLVIIQVAQACSRC